ncbi:hypothetical protein evm_008489 [Chilo suppressalis]|nr:hypothetical protein evm_008489 [Chilo suppressalis]
MFVSRDIRRLDPDEASFKKRALRDAVVCIGWLKITSTICYIVLYYFVHISSKGDVSMAIQIMVLTAIPLQILHGLLLFFGAIDEKPLALDIALWLCLALASYNTVLGVVGAIYFIRTGHFTVHFLLAVTFGILAISLFTVLCHDILVIFAYKQMLKTFPEQDSSNPAVGVVWNK